MFQNLELKTVQQSKPVEICIGQCFICKEDITEKMSYVTVENNIFHQYCFVCNQCLEPFTNNDGEFFQADGGYYCEFDFLLLHGSRCVRCGDIIKGRFINALDGKWHEDHFTCELCSRPLSGGSFFKKNGKPYCKVCIEKLKMNDFLCKGPITDNKIIYQGQKLHAYHFTCTTCKITLSSQNCKEFESRLYCIKDYDRMLSLNMICFGCRKTLTNSRSVTALGKQYFIIRDSVQFNALIVLVSIPNILYVASVKNLLHQKLFLNTKIKHIDEIKGDLCGHCYEPCVGGDSERGVVIALNRKWCEGHFCCVACQITIVPGKTKFSELDSKPYCLTCWNSLPFELRTNLNNFAMIEKKALEEKEKKS
ncbi:LIM and senescent cell antigen-like-containing domain protein 2 [Clydaea vesicula]|uniref:LIM and senescent cell antigen-like-containing domain protein 2 n=1 Tax=Clydaea vesicula TaxID=447962 RepID=A0AAD5U0F0_9FUNG|nr:LIM and senescent cell antigen-like-containing domain protein 2 [Clydaea vesicula]